MRRMNSSCGHYLSWMDVVEKTAIAARSRKTRRSLSIASPLSKAFGVPPPATVSTAWAEQLGTRSPGPFFKQTQRPLPAQV